MEFLDDPRTLAFAGLCAGVACSVATYQIYTHLSHYTHPTFQRYIVRIVFMVPVYSVSSWLSLMQRENQIYYDTIRDCYEAWVIYNFLSLCLAYVGGPGQVVVGTEGQSIHPSWIHGTCCMAPIPIDGAFVRRCKQGTLQFVFIKPVLAVIVFILEDYGVWDEESLSPAHWFFWVMLIYNVSYTVALYSLLLFYLGAKELLMPFNPVIKFITVKAVVFMTFWQGFAISLMVMVGAVEGTRDAKALQNLLICAEMVLGAFAMHYAYTNKDYRTPDGLQTERQREMPSGVSTSLTHAISIHDVAHDVVHQFAPAYHDYILYSDGTTGAPRKHRARTFVILGQEMTLGRLGLRKKVAATAPLAAAADSPAPDMDQLHPEEGSDDDLDHDRRRFSQPAELQLDQLADEPSPHRADASQRSGSSPSPSPREKQQQVVDNIAKAACNQPPAGEGSPVVASSSTSTPFAKAEKPKGSEAGIEEVELEIEI
mmetsp:Transcript_35240/g.77025  ORF Transcript_35240/g.77025 Transcript_35240/m.77025 type:complete len:483 (-) Transcript_35240:219-1667(-)|eukprot:CAMPEP_0118926398 /NCGR_PEP_ID=MMETSP1169-20130426/4084_1 /TAXON_ID=36882 /ORGANISM="Pyramimonas obovata, Strain CCMP722" /LENGTH=482 /DNA_ID=CAMNT_0006867937 /DNA_START=495 /DNA_END=1943 /DNA_ORIENTATION=-